MKKESKIWLDLAKEDYKDMIVMKKNKRYRGAVLFAQQAVEKILKAYIVEKQNQFPKYTHNINLLMKDSKLNLLEINNPDVTNLSLAYTRVRYADISNVYYRSKEKVEPILKVAKAVYLWVKNKLINN